ncbi:uncharacterized protein LOC115769186 [Drosophila novamexicana]|uniref:uncharacterized protein LOC115769186 n=1 Tax=Drosophila novamexicana TaxID=47314 RepID=UPI0011E5DADF|nr:uncharacterized protein LOC115769186 [Drosophila novamexicana]
MDTFWTLLYLSLGLIGCLHLGQAKEMDSVAQPNNATGAHPNILCNPACGDNMVCVEPNNCRPVCTQGCGEHGICSARDTCGCEPGYEFDVEHYRCLPKCWPACGPHSVCKERDICECLPGFSGTDCQPDCDKDCGEHGTCVAPNKCACKEGYDWHNKTNTCRPKCHPLCGPNSQCVRPDVCQCMRGYAELNGICHTMCPHGCGQHGICVGIGKCVCDTGYEWDKLEAKCRPKCEPRCGLHSYCDRSNHCKCNKGFIPNDLHSLSCSRPLSWWIYLVIAIMVLLILCSVIGIIVYCVKRGNNVSYYPNSNFSDTSRIVGKIIPWSVISLFMTHPWLVLALVLASCPWMWAQRGSVCQVRVRSKSGKLDKQSWVLRNVCCKGYVGSPGNCRPRCSPSCVHAQCTAPQQCTCNEGYETVDSIDSSNMPGCQPKCNACRYGDCLAPGNCRCWPSFEKQPIVGCEPVQHLILPAEQCLREDCSCWQKYFSWTPLLTVQPKCVSICRTGQPKPCLELEQCVCNSLNHLLICEQPEHVLPQQYGCQVINGPPTAYRRKHTVKHIDRTVSTDLRDRKNRTDRPTKIFPVWTHHYNQSDEESKITQANREVQSDRQDKKVHHIVDQKNQESRADNTQIGSRIDHRPGRPDRLDRRHRKDQLERPDVPVEKVDRYHTYDSAQTDPTTQTGRPVQTFHLFGKHKKNQTNQPDPTDQVTASDWPPQADENEEDHTENIHRREPKNWEYETDRLDQQPKRRKDHAKRHKQKPILFEADDITQADKSDRTDPVNQSDPATETVPVPVQPKSNYPYMTKSEQASLVKWLIILGCIIIGIIVVVSLFAVCFKMQSPLDICERDIM